MKVTVYITVDQWSDTLLLSMTSICSRTDTGTNGSQTKGHVVRQLVLTLFTDKLLGRYKFCPLIFIAASCRQEEVQVPAGKGEAMSCRKEEGYSVTHWASTGNPDNIHTADSIVATQMKDIL